MTLLGPFDEGSMTTLIMLDLSAAFDVIDHLILLNYLEFSFGIREKALNWVKSYLNDRIKCVSVVDKTSPDVSLLFGVPQASVLGPKNYCMYTKTSCRASSDKCLSENRNFGVKNMKKI